MDIRDQIIQELDNARAHMQHLIAELDSDAEVYPGWTVKELLAHITGWDDLVINTLNRHLTGMAPILAVNRGIDFYNATTVAEREGLPFEHILREYEATREQLKALLRSIPPERFADEITLPWGPKATVQTFIRVFSEHEREHEEEIHSHLRRS